MKHTFSRRRWLQLAATVPFAAGCSRVAPPSAEHILVVAEGVRGARRAAIWDHTYDLIVDKAAPGEWVHVISAPSGKPVGSILVGEGDEFDRITEQETRAAIAGLAQFFEDPNPGYSQDLSIPSVGAWVAKVRQTGLPLRLSLFGSAMYVSDQHYGVSMEDGHVPRDGCLKADRAPFGAGVVPLPAGAKMTITTTDDQWGYDETHRQEVIRFWRLFFAHHGGELVGVGSDPANAFRFTRSQFVGELQPVDDGFGRRDTKAETPAVIEANDAESSFGDKVVDRMVRAAKSDGRSIVFAVKSESGDPPRGYELHVASRGESRELTHDNKRAEFGAFYDASYHSRATSEDLFTHVAAVRVHHTRAADIDVWLRALPGSSPTTLRVIAVWQGQVKRGRVSLTPPTATGEARSEANGWKRVSLFTPTRRQAPLESGGGH